MNLSLELTTCPSCAGFGVVAADQGVTTCPTCTGSGMNLQSGSTKLTYPLPELVTPEGENIQRLRHWLKQGFYALAFLVTLAAAAKIISGGIRHASDLVWHVGWPHALFGLGGLVSMWGLSHWNTHHTSVASLLDLPTRLAAQPPPSAVDLSDYANDRVGKVLKQAAFFAQQLHTKTVDEAILLLTILEQPRTKMMLSRLEIAPADLIEGLRRRIPTGTEGHVTAVTYQPAVRQRLYAGVQTALRSDFPYLDVEDILLSFAEEPGQLEPFFTQFHLGPKEVYAIARWYADDQERSRKWAFWLERGRLRPKGYMNRAWTALPTPFLDHFSTDITRLVANGQASGISVRTAELQQTLEILGGTQQNSVLLVGEPGVGKNTLLDTVALRMVEENVPEPLKDKRLVQLDLASLLGAEGSAEENIQHILEEVSQAGNVILAIPEVQGLVGTTQDSLDAASVLANAISKGLLQVISTATYADFHRYVESNPTLASLLTVVELPPLTAEQTERILEEEAPNIEGHQHIFLTYPALEAAAKLAEQYLTDQALPSSAIKLLDQAASAAGQAKRKWVLRRDIEQAVERLAKVPVQKANQEESDKLLHFEDLLHKRIVGQEEAVHAVSEALRRARAGLHDSKRPISSFLFVGPTGVGKTEMAKAVTDLYFGKEASMIRLDMSEYQDNRSVYRLIGAPPASSESYTEGGALTQPIREHPFSLILLDELEKADPEVLNLFLQLLDDGRLTENTGRVVHFNNAIIIATSNAGSAHIAQLIQQGVSGDQLHSNILGLLQQNFKPEFLNRFDAIIPFHALRQDEIAQITTLMLQDVIRKAAEQGLTISFTPEAVATLGQQGYDPTYGARPLRRVIQDKAEGLLAKLILEKRLSSGQSLQITPEMLQ